MAASAASAAPTVILNNGRSMPAFGLGTWQAAPGEVGRAVGLAIDAGYRHIDCALLYQNEQEIGAAIREKIAQGVVKREDLFVTSKLWNSYHRPDLVLKGCKKTLKNFGLDYIDLYLIHWPIGFKSTDRAESESKEHGTLEGIMGDEEFMPKDSAGNILFSDDDYVDTWKAMEECQRLGLAKSIGVSNFNVQQMTRLLAAATIKPVTNQIEIHPYLQQTELVNFCNAQKVAVVAYCPLGSARTDLGYTKVLDHPTVIELAKQINKTPAQLVLRFLVQLNTVPIPKSTNPERLRQNIDVFNFSLTPDQMAKLAALDSNKRICFFPGSENHPHNPF